MRVVSSTANSGSWVATDGHERSAAAGDEVDGLRRRCRSRRCSRPGRTPRPRAPRPRRSRRTAASSARRTRRRDSGRPGGSTPPMTSSPPASTSLPTCRSTSSRCSSRGERPHRDALAARVADDDLLGEPGAQGVDHGIHRRRSARSPAGSRCTSARPSTVISAISWRDVRVELGGAGHGIRAQHRRVDRVGLAREHDAAGLHRRRATRRRSAVDADPVNATRSPRRR